MADALGDLIASFAAHASELTEKVGEAVSEHHGKPPPLTAAVQAEMDADVDWLRSVLDETWVDDDDEEAAIARVQKWADRDQAYERLTTYAGTDHLDAMLRKMKNRTFWTDSFSTLYVDQMTSVYDMMYDEMEGGEYQKWLKLVGSSKRERTKGRNVEKMESAWTNIGRSVGQTGFGLVKGSAQGMAGLGDTAVWGVNKLLASSGSEVRFESGAARWVGEQWDDLGNEVFGREHWERSDAKDIATGGGRLVFGIATAGYSASTNVAMGAQGSRILAWLSAVGAIEGFEKSLDEFFDVLVAVEAQDPPLTWEKLVGNPDFLLACTDVGLSIAGAVSKGQITSKEAASQLTGRLSKLGRALRATTRTAETTLKLSQVGARTMKIIEISGRPGLQSDERQALIRDEVLAIGKLAVDEATSLAANRDAARAHEVREALAKSSQVDVDEPPMGEEPPMGDEPGRTRREEAEPIRRGEPESTLSSREKNVTGGGKKPHRMTNAAVWTEDEMTRFARDTRLRSFEGWTEGPHGTIGGEGFAGRTDETMYMVRFGEAGSGNIGRGAYGDHLFPDAASAEAYVYDMLERASTQARETGQSVKKVLAAGRAIPEEWLTGESSKFESVKVWEVPPTAFWAGPVAPQIEGAAHARGDVIPGGNWQVLIDPMVGKRLKRASDFEIPIAPLSDLSDAEIDDLVSGLGPSE